MSRGAHYNRAGRKGGGDRKFIVPRIGKGNAFRLAVCAMIETNPNWSLERCGDEAMKFPGATMEKVQEILIEYCGE